MNKFLKELMKLATELNQANGFYALVIINEMELLYDKNISEVKTLNIDIVRVMLPENSVPRDLAKEFTDNKLKVVNTLLSDDYKTGYREGITHFIEAKGN